MKFEEILEILQDPARTEWQKSADIHARIVAANRPSALNLKPMVERKRRNPSGAKRSNGQPQPSEISLEVP